MPNANNRTQRNHIVQKKDILHCNLQYMIKVKETFKSKRAILCLFVVIYHHKIGNYIPNPKVDVLLQVLITSYSWILLPTRTRTHVFYMFIYHLSSCIILTSLIGLAVWLASRAIKKFRTLNIQKINKGVECWSHLREQCERNFRSVYDEWGKFKQQQPSPHQADGT